MTTLIVPSQIGGFEKIFKTMRLGCRSFVTIEGSSFV